MVTVSEEKREELRVAGKKSRAGRFDEAVYYNATFILRFWPWT
jgi:hypothetical protein